MATLKDIADHAGLSLTTVSRVLNNRGYISEETRRRVYAAMEELNYHFDKSASVIRRKHSKNIGIILPEAGEFNYMILSAVEHCCYEYWYNVMVCVSKNEVERERSFAAMLRANKVAGMILRSSTQDISAFKMLDLPVVAIERGKHEGVVSVSCDNYGGGEMATRHLIECGCRKLAYVGSFIDLDKVGNQRLDAFRSICREAGVECYVAKNREGIADPCEVLEKFPEVDGIFASGDMTAVQSLITVMRYGRKVPEDVKIVGFDETTFTKHVAPELTAVVQPIEDMGRCAVRLIIDMLEGRKVAMHTVLPVSLNVRGSTVACRWGSG